MPTRMNPMAGRYFNDPNFAAGISNLASAFAPPSADEALGWAKLRGVNDENARLSTLWEAAGNDFDRMGVAAGQWNPTQSYYAVNTADATTRRGQDISAETSRLNNAADNERALRGMAFGAYADPAGRQAGGDPVMDAILGFDVPEYGMAGPVAPTETQVEGDLLLEAINGGLIGPADAMNAYTSDIPLEQVVGDDGEPVFIHRGNAVGRTPFINRGAEAAPQAITFVRDGVRMGGFVQDGRFIDANGQPLSAEEAGTAARIGQPQGTNEELGITNSNQTDFNRVQQTVTVSNLLIDELEGLIGSRPGASGLPGTIQMLGQDFLQVGRELGAAFGGDPNAIVTPDMLAGIGGDGANYDPVFRQIRAGMLQLAYLNAQRDNPRGEVSRFALERQIEALGQGMLSNDQAVLAALQMSRSANARALAGAQALVGQTAPVAGATPPVQPPGGGTRIRYDADGNRME